MMDNRTGRSRGFGYIKFRENSAVDSVLAQKPHIVDHKEVDPKRCNVNMKGKNRRSLKVFVGGVAFEHDESTIRNFFSNYGRVTDVNLLTSPNKQRHRGFAFVGFEDEEVVKNLIRMHYVNLDGKQVEVKAMEPPIGHRTGYPIAVGGSAPLQTNGRAVRGGRNHNFPQLQPSDPYVPWNQWPGMGSGSWNAAGGPVGPHPAWNPQQVGWSGGTSNGAPPSAHHGMQPGTAAHLSNLGPVHGVGWPQQPGPAANGWLQPTWNSQFGASSTNNRGLGDDASLLSYQQQQQHQRKSQGAWDPLCFAALTSSSNSGSNHNDSVNSLESWNSAAANALCQLAPLSIGSGLAHTSTGAADWNQAPAPGSVSNQHWSASTTMSMVGTNSIQHGSATPNGMQSGYLNDQSIAAMAAAAASFGMRRSGNSTVPHWASSTSGHRDVAGLKLDGTVFQPSCGYGLPSTGPATNSNVHANLQHPPNNGMLHGGGEWRTVAATQAASGTSSISGFHSTPQHPLYQR
ncbi:unnamed protein product [Dicrocoelium dendriticum]|nr:unnamed protein product [Dicrocoelium dendriticum]